MAISSKSKLSEILEDERAVAIIDEYNVKSRGLRKIKVSKSQADI